MQADHVPKARLIGYGLHSLVFRPPFLSTHRKANEIWEKNFLSRPDEFVGLVTTKDRFDHDRIQLKQLHSMLSNHRKYSAWIAQPYPLIINRSWHELEKSEVAELSKQYFAVYDRIAHKRTWNADNLVQVFYPYLGNTLASIVKQRKLDLAWRDLFLGLVDIAGFLKELHGHGYVHGDLSPNNILVQQNPQSGWQFVLIDWEMLSVAEAFTGMGKGERRVACWSPEHFCLATQLLGRTQLDQRWRTYATEMARYTDRLIRISTDNADDDVSKSLEKYLFGQLKNNSIYKDMYARLLDVRNTRPSLIGFYHDIRYLMDTVALSVNKLFPVRTLHQKRIYNRILALALSQNLPDRDIYLNDPRLLVEKVTALLSECAKCGTSDHVAGTTATISASGTPSERALLSIFSATKS